MGGPTTEAGAQGNASALAYYLETNPPHTHDFSTVLTEEQEAKHFRFNDNILEHAGRLQNFYRQRDLLASGEDGMWNAHAVAVANGNTAMAREIENLIANPTEYTQIFAASIAEREEAIEQVIYGVRDQYRGLAEALSSGRNQYVQTRTEVNEAEDRYIAVLDAYAAQQSISDADRNWDEPQLTSADVRQAENEWFENDEKRHQLREFETTFGNYRLLQEGVAIRTTWDIVEGLVWAGVGLVVVEIITGGMINFAIAGGVGVIRVVGATRAGTLIASRYLALTRVTQEALERIRLRLRGRDVPDTPETNGMTDEVVDTPPATPRGACALC